MKKFNINSDVKVKLTAKGKEIYKKQHQEIFDRFPDLEKEIKEDEQGYSNWQLWTLMQEFGPHIHLGSENCFETNILIEDKNFEDFIEQPPITRDDLL